MSNETRKKFDLAKLFPFAAAALAALAAAVMVVVGAESNVILLAAAAVLLFAAGAAVWMLLELPVLPFVRLAFVLSFFVKLDLSLLKVDETEDPSGLNFSLTVACAVILLAHDWYYEENAESKVFPFAFVLLLSGLLICAVLSVVYSDYELLGVLSLWSLAGSVLIACALASHYAQRERLIELVLMLTAGLIFNGAVSSSQFVIGFPLNLPTFGTGTENELAGTQAVVFSRSQGFLRTPTEMGWVISVLMSFVVAPLICRVKDFGIWTKLCFATAGLASAAAIILSLARGSWGGLVLAMVILLIGGFWRLTPAERSKYLFTMFGASLLAVLMLAPFSSKIYDRLTGDDEDSAATRIPLLQVAGNIISHNRTVGIGLSSYRSQMTKYDNTGVFISQVFPAPVHNVFAHVTAEIGIPGGVFFALLILWAMWTNWRTMRAASNFDALRFALALALFAGLAAWIASAMKEPAALGSVRPAMRTLFFMFGATLAVSRLQSAQTNWIYGTVITER